MEKDSRLTEEADGILLGTVIRTTEDGKTPWGSKALTAETVRITQRCGVSKGFFRFQGIE